MKFIASLIVIVLCFEAGRLCWLNNAPCLTFITMIIIIFEVFWCVLEGCKWLESKDSPE